MAHAPSTEMTHASDVPEPPVSSELGASIADDVADGDGGERASRANATACATLVWIPCPTSAPPWTTCTVPSAKMRTVDAILYPLSVMPYFAGSSDSPRFRHRLAVLKVAMPRAARRRPSRPSPSPTSPAPSNCSRCRSYRQTASHRRSCTGWPRAQRRAAGAPRLRLARARIRGAVPTGSRRARGTPCCPRGEWTSRRRTTSPRGDSNCPPTTPPYPGRRRHRRRPCILES